MDINEDQCIPVRLYLTGFELTPTYTNVQNKFSVRYFLNLVLVDEEDRRYFKQQEILGLRGGFDACDGADTCSHGCRP